MRTLGRGEFHGRRRDTLRFGGLTLAETEYAPGHRLPLHAHANPFFSLLLRGSFTEKLERGGRRCVPTSLVYYPENDPHAEAFDERGGRSFNVELGPAWLAALLAQGTPRPPRSVQTRAGRLNWLATRLYRDFVAAADTDATGIEELVIEMMGEMGRLDGLGSERRAPAWLGRVVDLLHARFREVPRIPELADEAGVHPVHLARVFRRHHGCTVGEYVRRLRVEHACAELTDPDTSLSALAFRTGFSDQAHFTRRFKEITGLSPGAYRSLLAD